MMEALKGTYEGGCKKNKATGTGTATGQDSYTGEFKNGYPDGKGKYTWKNGEWFAGQWKKGQREGEGSMHYVGKNSMDSVQTGYWKKDVYSGQYEKPYIVHYKTSEIVGLDISREKSPNSEITFVTQSTSGGATGLGGQNSKLAISTIDVLSGHYTNRSDYSNMLKTNRTVLRGIAFPFRLRATMGTEVVEIEFLEEGQYNVDIRINK